MKILLDTSFLIELKKGNKNALKILIDRKSKTQDILVSSLTIYELLAGAHYILKKHDDIKELKQIQKMLQNLTEAIIDIKVIWKAAELKADLLVSGVSVPDIDIIIACSEEAEILTYDKDFKPLNNFGFKITVLNK